jgi:NodT family efflux transporter outer membrane factor (OMF) lipoprotein
MKLLIAISCVSFLVGCSLAPKYQQPELPIPHFYKESGEWLLASPESADLKRGPWWQMFGDPILNDLEQRVSCANQSLKAALARFEEARANVTIVRSALFPSVTGVFNANRERTSKTIANPHPIATFNDFTLGALFTYELDIWGRVRNSVAAAKSLACASAADLATLDLSLHAELANDYFALRGADKAQQVLDCTVLAYQKALAIVLKRYQEGIASAYDIGLAQNQLESAKTLALDNRIKRDSFEHAIAILIGQVPATFSLPVIKDWHNCLVTAIPPLPSCLLERRPDIAEAEQRVIAANANIGVARAAFFPQVNLLAGIGFESSSLAKLFDPKSLVWSLGPLPEVRTFIDSGTPLITQILFDAGKTEAITNQTVAKYWETVANYRQTVLTSFREVEDALLAIRQLDRENRTQSAAAAAARQALQHAVYRYREGITTYLDTIVVNIIALQAKLNIINIQTQRQIASVQLIRALGGGWDSCGR